MVAGLDEIERLLDSAKTADDVFGNATYHHLAREVHPDLHPDNHDRAKKLLQRLNHWKAIADKPELIEIDGKSLALGASLGNGDVSDVRYATLNDEQFVLKIGRTPGVSNLLAKEREILVQLVEHSENVHYKAYFPRSLSTFLMPDKRRVNTFRYLDGYATAGQIKDKHPKGLDPRHIVWMFKRIMVAVGYAHRSGWVHGGVLPPHLLFEVDKHGLMLIDWTLAEAPGKPLKFVSTAFRDWYPPECSKKAPASPGTDIYMAAKCMLWLAGHDGMPEKMRSFFGACLLESPKMRPQDAWSVHDRFDELARSLYGPPKFVSLKM